MSAPAVPRPSETITISLPIVSGYRLPNDHRTGNMMVGNLIDPDGQGVCYTLKFGCDFRFITVHVNGRKPILIRTEDLAQSLAEWSAVFGEDLSQ
jgi:hypothetical protein